MNLSRGPEQLRMFLRSDINCGAVQNNSNYMISIYSCELCDISESLISHIANEHGTCGPLSCH